MYNLQNTSPKLWCKVEIVENLLDFCSRSRRLSQWLAADVMADGGKVCGCIYFFIFYDEYWLPVAQSLLLSSLGGP